MLKLASVIIYGAEFVGDIISVQFTILIFTLPEEEEDDQVISALFITRPLFWYFARSSTVAMTFPRDQYASHSIAGR